MIKLIKPTDCLMTVKLIGEAYTAEYSLVMDPQSCQDICQQDLTPLRYYISDWKKNYHTLKIYAGWDREAWESPVVERQIRAKITNEN